MKKHILASDYDGTLKRNGTVSESDLKAIDRFKHAGNLFGLVTGRSIMMILPELKHFSVPFDFIIGNNGAIIVDDKLNCLYCKNIDLNRAFDLIENFDIEDCMLGISNGYEHSVIKPWAEMEKGNLGSKVIANRKYRYGEVMTRGCINSFFLRTWDNDAARKVIEILDERYGDAIAFHLNNGAIDASAVGVNKVTGIQWLKEKYPNMQVHVIGDAHNDVEMIKAFKGFAVKNAVEEAKEAASLIVEGIEETIELLMGDEKHGVGKE